MEAEFDASCEGMGRGGGVVQLQCLFFHTWTRWEDAELDLIALRRHSLRILTFREEPTLSVAKMGHPSNALREAVSIERHEGLGKTTLTWQKLGGAEGSVCLVRKVTDFSRSLTAFFNRLKSFIMDMKREDSDTDMED